MGFRRQIKSVRDLIYSQRVKICEEAVAVFVVLLLRYMSWTSRKEHRYFWNANPEIFRNKNLRLIKKTLC
jgi:hypothetical protein